MYDWMAAVCVHSFSKLLSFLIFVILDDFYGASHVYIPCIWAVPLFA